jgi:hypothetical protein
MPFELYLWRLQEAFWPIEDASRIAFSNDKQKQQNDLRLLQAL